MLLTSLFILFQTDAITQTEEVVSPTMLIVVAIFLTSIITGVFLWLLLLRISFFKNAVQGEGVVAGLTPAKYSGRVAANIPYVGSIKSNDSTASGYLLSIEYEVGDYIYRTKSKKVYTEYSKGDTIPVFYREDNPEDCSVDGIYEINPILGYGMSIGGAVVTVVLGVLLFMV